MARFTRKPDGADARRATKQQLLDTHMGVALALPGDWIITALDGEEYPVRDDVFRRNYEPADADARALLEQGAGPHQSVRDFVAANLMGRP